MPAKRPNRLRSAGKVEERDLLAAARAHADDPDLVQVRCVGPHLFCPVKRLSAELARIHAKRDDEAFLKRRSERGRGLARGYAGTLLLAKAEKAPYVAQAKLPIGTYPYIVRGGAAAEHYLGLQHWEDPQLRLLAFKDLVKKRKYRFFAVGDHVLTTHRRGVPVEFVDATASRLGLRRVGDGLFACPHPEAAPAIVVRWPRAGLALRRCAACLGEANLGHQVLEHAAVPDPSKEFEPDVAFAPIGGAPEPRLDLAAEREAWRKAGKDRDLVNAAVDARRRALEATPPPFFVLGERSWREAAAFADALAPTPAERRALLAALADPPRAVVLDKASPARALEAVWSERGRAALAAAAEDATGALHFEDGAPADRIAELVRKAEDRGRAARAEVGLPRYGRLPAPVAAADRAARAWRKGGRDAALRALADGSPGAERAIVLAVRRALDAAEGHAWKYAEEEKDLGAALVPAVRRLLDAAPAEYHDALAALAREAGVAERFAPAS